MRRGGSGLISVGKETKPAEALSQSLRGGGSDHPENRPGGPDMDLMDVTAVRVLNAFQERTRTHT